MKTKDILVFIIGIIFLVVLITYIVILLAEGSLLSRSSGSVFDAAVRGAIIGALAGIVIGIVKYFQKKNKRTRRKFHPKPKQNS